MNSPFLKSVEPNDGESVSMYFSKGKVHPITGHEGPERE
jgi:hypothetical protein